MYGGFVLLVHVNKYRNYFYSNNAEKKKKYKNMFFFNIILL